MHILCGKTALLVALRGYVGFYTLFVSMSPNGGVGGV